LASEAYLKSFREVEFWLDTAATKASESSDVATGVDQYGFCYQLNQIWTVGLLLPLKVIKLCNFSK